MRWLVPTKELLADPGTASLVEDSTQRYFVGSRGGGLVWYSCRKYVQDSPVLIAMPAKFADLAGMQQRGTELPLPLTVVRKREYHRRYVHPTCVEKTLVTFLRCRFPSRYRADHGVGLCKE
jgi:hypothetical protein